MIAWVVFKIWPVGMFNDYDFEVVKGFTKRKKAEKFCDKKNAEGEADWRMKKISIVTAA